MNQKEKLLAINSNQRKYCSPQTPSPRQRNAYYFGSGDWNHEVAKLKACWELKQKDHDFITEARIKGEHEIADVIDLVTNERYEIETSKERAQRFNGKDITVIKLWE